MPADLLGVQPVQGLLGAPRGEGLLEIRAQARLGYTPRLTVGETAALGCEWRPSEEGRCHVPAPARDPESGALPPSFSLYKAHMNCLVKVSLISPE